MTYNLYVIRFGPVRRERTNIIDLINTEIHVLHNKKPDCFAEQRRVRENLFPFWLARVFAEREFLLRFHHKQQPWLALKFSVLWPNRLTSSLGIFRAKRAFRFGCLSRRIWGSRVESSDSTSTWIWCWMKLRRSTSRRTAGSSSVGFCWKGITSPWWWILPNDAHIKVLRLNHYFYLMLYFHFVVFWLRIVRVLWWFRVVCWVLSQVFDEMPQLWITIMVYWIVHTVNFCWFSAFF